MPKTLTVRSVDEALIVKLKVGSARHSRSAEAEARAILARGLADEPRQDFWILAKRLRALTAGRRHKPSEVLVSERRDER